MYQTGGTIHETLRLIAERKYVLPAIQREFVWKPDQICKPTASCRATLLGHFFSGSWKPDATGQYKFYEFVRHYHRARQPTLSSVRRSAEWESDSRSGWPATADCTEHWSSRINDFEASKQVVE